MEYPAITNKDELLAQNWIEIDPTQQKDLCGVYCLVNRETGKAEYIGQAFKVGKRLNYEHHIYQPEIHKVMFLVLDRTMLDYYEALSISLLHPSKNRRNGRWSKDAIAQYADSWWREYNKTL